MPDLFTPNVPAPNSPVASAEIRSNFSAIYDKVQTLEPRGVVPSTTAISVAGGPTYFRSGSSARLSLINFQTSLIDLASAQGYATIKNFDGSLSRALLTNRGVSPWSAIGLFRELLVSLNNQGKLVFTEGDTTTTGLSRPFNIYFDDGEIPICLVMIHQTGPLLTSGQLKPIEQIDVTDIRSFVTSAFQNNLTASTLQGSVEDVISRVDAVESSIQVTNSLLARIPPADKLAIDGTTSTNTKIEVLSGNAYFGNRLFRFSGGTVDFAGAEAPSSLPINNFNRALVGLQLGPSGPALTVVHGTSTDSSPTQVSPPPSIPASIADGYGGIIAPTGVVPLAIISYRMSGTALPPAGTPAFGPARTYAALGSSVITNIGNSVLTGNLGLSPGTSVTGFPPGTVSGTQDITNAAAASAQASALSTYNDLSTRPAGTTESILDGLTLSPGTYTSASSMSLAGSGNATLTLNGAGVYIFQIGSTLTTGSGGTATMALTGGATAANVYWIVGSSASINAGAGIDPSTPAFGTARNYAALASSTITNTGSSVLTGNLGLSPGTSVVGFPPGTVSGTQDVSNAAAATAQASAQTTYNDLSTRPAGTTESILDGLTLVPGTYTSASSMSLAGSGNATLTLNGAGVYIFQIGSTLTTGAGGTPTITLTGGATSADIYWVVGSSATINSGFTGTFKGNVIAQASVTVTLGGTVNGTLAALTGAVTLSAATAIVAQPLTPSSSPGAFQGSVIAQTGIEVISGGTVNGTLAALSGDITLSAVTTIIAQAAPTTTLTTIVKPITSTVFIDGLRVNYDFTIVSIDSVTQFTVLIPTDVDPGSVFIQTQSVDICDDNTRPFRRIVSNVPVFNATTRTMQVQVTESFTEIVLARNPRARNVATHYPVVDDIRPFIGVS